MSAQFERTEANLMAKISVLCETTMTIGNEKFQEPEN
jgi:hypothetical protein